jgi:phosphatidylethanolamine-binding protein (PEBP) family uncharacterized protein
MDQEPDGIEASAASDRVLGNGAKQGKNDFGNLGYGGPAPPKGKLHNYGR